MKRLHLSGLFLWLLMATAFAQSVIPYGPKPTVGERMPDFTLTDITNYNMPKASLKDFKGKWLFLDFWFKNCLPCIKSFPKINKFQAEFKDDIQFVMVAAVDDKVNSWQKTEPTKNVFDYNKNLHKMIIPCAYDSVLAPKWGISSMPYIIIIDPNGIVRAITGGGDLTADKIKLFISGKTPSLALSKSDRQEFNLGVDHKNPKESDSLILFESVLAKYNYEHYRHDPLNYENNLEDFIRKGYRIVGLPLYMIYNLAFFGEPNWDVGSPLQTQIYTKPILELRDTSLFAWNNASDVRVGNYNYKLTLPAGQRPSTQTIMRIMQNDLQSYFNYDVSVETRKMPYIKLIAKDGAAGLLRNRGGSMKSEGIGGSQFSTGFKFTRYTIDVAFRAIINNLNQKYNVPIINETGIDYPVDLEIRTDMGNLSKLREALQEKGLDLIPSEKEFKVLVIREPKTREFITPESLLDSKLLNMQDSLMVNNIIKEYVPVNGMVNWREFENALSSQFSNSSLSQQLALKTRLEYSMFKRDTKVFDSLLLSYTSKFGTSLSPESMISYGNFIFKNSMNEDILYVAANVWRQVYLRSEDASTKDWYLAAVLLYKYGMIIKNNKLGPNIGLGNSNILGALNLMKIGVLKSEQNNQLFQETLRKMEKGEPIW